MRRICILCMVGILLLLPACKTEQPVGTSDELEIVKSKTYMMPTREALMDTANSIAAVRINGTHIADKTWTDDAGQETAIKMHIAEAVVTDALYGDLQTGQEIEIAHAGDNQTIAYDYILKDGGYPESGTQWLLYLKRDDKNTEDPYYYVSVTPGRYQLDEEGRVISQSEESKWYFGELETVEDMRKFVDGYLSDDAPTYVPLVDKLYPRNHSEMMEDTQLVVRATVQSVEKGQREPWLLDREADDSSEEKIYATVSTVRVEDVLYGSMERGKTIQIVQPGDEIHTVYECVRWSGDYLEKETSWLLLLRPVNEGNTSVYTISNVRGQYELNTTGDIVYLRYLPTYFDGCKTLEDLKNRLQSNASQVEPEAGY